MITDEQLDHMEQDAGSSDDTARLLALIREVRQLKAMVRTTVEAVFDTEAERDRLMKAVRKVCLAAHAAPTELDAAIYELTQTHDDLVGKEET